MKNQTPDKTYTWEAHYFGDIASGKIAGIGSIYKQRIRAKNPLDALQEIMKSVGPDNVDVVTVYTPFGRPVARFLSREAATIEDCVDSNLSHGEFPFRHEQIKFADGHVVIDGLEIPYHRSRTERRRETWVPI